jgi:hypothetical protein
MSDPFWLTDAQMAKLAPFSQSPTASLGSMADAF